MSGPSSLTTLSRRTLASPPRLTCQTPTGIGTPETHDHAKARVGQDKPDLFTPGEMAVLLVGTIGLMGAATISVPPTAPPAVACYTTPCDVADDLFHDDVDYGTLAFQLTRQQDGDVVVQFGKGDTVVNPAENKIYDSPGAAKAGMNQLGESLCEQAMDLGGDCVTDSLVFIPNGEHGILQVEQVGADKIQAGPVTMEFNDHGVKVDRPGPDVLFQYDAGTNHFDNW